MSQNLVIFWIVIFKHLCPFDAKFMSVLKFSHTRNQKKDIFRGLTECKISTYKLLLNLYVLEIFK